ncbi:V-set and immunoglobulin domain-containing protein 10 isoform X2 [Pundamilia nyererei]|uniref:V-set and immunoglobulin domain-containing protein 10 isoform X2 n=1 Tax=Pundamilia nyererei TaxID=303518 RepID=UPI0003AFDC84|nr:PREDICTED: V-set and immunoglobulin domain-containing protein 10 isoform X2 [Pundamilia nyererei]
MKVVATLALLQLYISATADLVTAEVSGNVSSETALSASPGDIVVLPCYSAGKVTPVVTTWTKNGREIVTGGDPTRRLIVNPDGSLNISATMLGDEGIYLCNSTLSDNRSFLARVLLQVTSGPENVSTSISPATALSNGTLYTDRGSSVTLRCSGSSYPSQHLTWAFSGDSSSNDSLVSGSGSSLEFTIQNIQPSAQGVYSCRAHNPVSNVTVISRKELLVYYVSDRHPECKWTLTQNISLVQFTCTWLEVYPTPNLRWNMGPFQVADSLNVTMSRSTLSDGQTVNCTAQPQHLGPEKEKSCSFTLELPFPEGEPMVSALEASNVTLACTETTSKPPAITTWRKGLQLDYIESGSKYILSLEGPVFKLTIVNVTKEDEGFYFCHSENPLGLRELEVELTVKTSSAYTGAVIGIFIAALIMGSAVIIAKIVYNSRDRICLGGFGQVDDDSGDVLSLVESDDEQVFQDAVPRLPPITNGHHTTLVQIHRIPSSDHEDAETADTSPQQQEDTVQTEEPVQLVEF